MTVISLTICLAVVGYVMWLSTTKKEVREKIALYIQQEKFNELANYIHTKKVKMVLKKGQYDTYELLALFEMNELDAFNRMIQACVSKEYPEDEKVEMMVYFYHLFLVKENKEYANKLKELLATFENEERMVYHQQLFELTFDGHIEFINDMEVKVEKELYVKNDLGVICYFLALQHLKTPNVGIAKIYRDSAQRYIYAESPYLSKIVSLKKVIDQASSES